MVVIGMGLNSIAVAILLLAATASYASEADGVVVGDVARGQDVYNGTCVACHGKNGKGELPGIPDLTRADGPLSQSDDVLIKNMIEGVATEGAFIEMPPMGGNPDLSEQDIVHVLWYMRDTFGQQ